MKKQVHRYELWQAGLMVACVECATKRRAWQEIMHYAMFYLEDGPVEIREGKNAR